MKVALYSNRFNQAWFPFLENLIEILLKKEFKVVLCKKLFDEVKSQTFSSLTFIEEERLSDLNPDILITIGGDGTLLSSIQYIINSRIPIMGINTGRLGSLASVSKEEIDSALELLKQQKFVYDKRTLLQIETPKGLFGNVDFALNELTIHKNEVASMITIHAYIDNQYLNSYWADGLIISTPTGSTAYSLSCGGPIVLADTDTFIVTPIAPHNLNVRPMVISDRKKITLKIEGRSHKYLVSLDSHSNYIDADTELTISKSPFTISLIKLEGYTFFDTIRNKLLWGIDRRN